jgi:hypothetical protein
MVGRAAANLELSWNAGTTCAHIHQIARVFARFWIHAPLFQNAFANVGASKSATPQYHECVGRLRYVYSKFQIS